MGDAGGDAGLKGSSLADLDDIEIEQQKIAEIGSDAAVDEAALLEPLTDAERSKLRARTVAPRGFKSIWSTKGSGASAKASVWAPSTSRPMTNSNRVRICVGHHVSAGLNKPDANGALLLEIHDTSMLGIQNSPLLPRAVAQLTPRPVGFRLLWSCTGGSGGSGLFVWRPLPPSDAFVTLGVVCTGSEVPPDLEQVRCVPSEWTSLCHPEASALVWRDDGLGGKPGSLWNSGSPPKARLMAATSGHSPPADVRELAARDFALGAWTPQAVSASL